MWFERIIWFPVLVAYAVALGVSGKHLNSPPVEPATAQTILSFAGVIAGFTITYSPLGSDFTTYLSPDGPRSDFLSDGFARSDRPICSHYSWRIFPYSVLGFVGSIVSLHVIWLMV